MGEELGSGSQCLNSEARGGWLCRNRESPTSSRLVTRDPQITHLVFFLHREQGTLGTDPSLGCGQRPAGSAPRVSPPPAGKFLRISGWSFPLPPTRRLSLTPALKPQQFAGQVAGVAGLGPKEPRRLPPRGLRAGPA